MLLSMYGRYRPNKCYRADASRSYALPAGALSSWLERMARKASMRFTMRGGHLRPCWLSLVGKPNSHQAGACLDAWLFVKVLLWLQNSQ